MLSWLKAFCKAIAAICGVLLVVLSFGELIYLTGQHLHAQFQIVCEGIDAGLFCFLVLVIIVVVAGVTVLFKD